MTIIYDDFNSRIFSLRMGNVLINNGNEDTIDSLDKTELYDHLSVKIPTNNKVLLNNFLAQGFVLVDTQITYVLDEFSALDVSENSNNAVRSAEGKDKAQILNIARQSFTIDRFHSDSSLDSRSADKYYADWASNLLKDITTISDVYIKNDNVAGFAFWKIENETARLILVAVSEKNRGEGIYRELISSFVLKHRKKIKQAITGTQINNVGVNKFWGRSGAYIYKSEYVLHKKIT